VWRHNKPDWPERNLAIRPERKNQLGKSEQKYITNNKNLHRKNGKSRNSCAVKVESVGDEGVMTLQKVGALV